MEPKMIKDSTGAGQRNLNTILLTLCVMGIGWVCKEITNLEVMQATQGSQVTANSAAIGELRKAVNDQTIITEKIDIRLSRVETIQDQTKK
jgi:hypothetical protein